MVEVTLAGYNIDIGGLEETLKQEGFTDQEIREIKDNITPEIISAAYARISRSPKKISDIRKGARADVKKARASNENIVYGLGHSSVAEHVYFNFDITGVSRLAIEYLEKHRLAAYTEKSQRYVTLEGDYVTPEEIKGTRLEEKYHSLIQKQYKLYDKIREALEEKIFREEAEKQGIKKKDKEEIKKIIAEKEGKAKVRTLEGKAKEDARYVLGLGTEGQLGLSCNARELAHIIRNLKSNPLMELQQLAKQLEEEAEKIAPSLIKEKYTEPTSGSILREQTTELEKIINEEMEKEGIKITNKESRMKGLETKTVYANKEGDYYTAKITLLYIEPEITTKTIATIIHKTKKTDWGVAYQTARKLSEEGKREIIEKIMKKTDDWGPTIRELETSKIIIEIILSSSAYGQIKRHRMSTQIPQGYDPELGYTKPPQIRELNKKEIDHLWEEVMTGSNELYYEIKEEKGEKVAEYALTNAHRRRIIISMNFRELFAFSLLRLDKHAQWDIRTIGEGIKELVMREDEIIGSYLMGKDEYKKWKEAA